MLLFNWILCIFLVIVEGQTNYDVEYKPLFVSEYLKYDAIEPNANNSCYIKYQTHFLFLVCPTDINCYLKTYVRETFLDLYNQDSSLQSPCKPMDKEQLSVNKAKQLNATLEILRLTNETVCEFSSVETLDVRNNGLDNMGQLGRSNCRKQDDDDQCPYKLKYLNVDNFKIVRLYNNSFCRFRRLEHLSLLECGIKSIEADAFNHLTNLKEISLYGNDLTHLPADLFASNLRLQAVSLNRNKLQFQALSALLPINNSLRYLSFNNNSATIRNDRFRFPAHLEQLYLDENNLQKISFEFANLTNVTRLTVDKNSVSAIDENAFADLQEVKIMNLENNEIEKLHRNTFKNTLKLETLRLRHNKLIRFPPIAHLQNLKGIELTNNKIKFINKTDLLNCTRLSEVDLFRNELIYVEKGSFDNVRQLNRLVLSENRLTQLSVDFQNSNILEIYLENNNLTAFSYEMFPHSLVGLALAHNQIETIEPFDYRDQKTRDLKYLRLANNKIKSIRNLEFTLKLQALDLRGNQISTLCESDLKKNRILTITALVSGNPLKCTCENMWVKNPQPSQKIQFADLDVTDCRQTNPYNNNTLVTLARLNNDEFLCQSDYLNNFRCECPMYDDIQCALICPINCTCLSNFEQSIIHFMCNSRNFRHNPNYFNYESGHYATTSTITLDLSGNSIARVNNFGFGNLTSKLIRLNLDNSSVESIEKNAFDKLINLRVLILANNRLEELPFQIFYKLTRLVYLNLSNNRLTQLADDTFTAQIHLQYLYLHNNNLHRLKLHEIMKISSMKNITLDNNPWSCECSFIEPFRAFLVNSSTAVNNKLELNCSENGEEFNISNFNLEKCLTQINSTILIASLTFGLLLAVVVGLLFKWRYELRVLMYARYGFRMFHRRPTEEDITGMQYDAFVAYNSADTDFLINDLMPGLEEIDNPYRLCIHQRDFPVGAIIQDSILEAIEMSCRTIIVLSENFVSSGWCRFEFKSAHMQMMQDRCPRVLVILMGEIPGALDPEMKLYLKTNTYLKWGEKLFWQKLYYAMPDKRVTTPATDIMPMRDF